MVQRLTTLLVILIACISEINASVVRPEDFGAVGDGVTDDTQAFELAINTGKEVYVEGTYVINEIRLMNNQRLIGKRGALIYYTSIVLTEGCHLKNIILDGQWKTKGVSILGSNIIIDGCYFLNTKNTTPYYGGLTSAIRVGQYQDLEDNQIKYHNIKIKNCTFDGCEPSDTMLRKPDNKSTARCILSYGCDNLIINKCNFRNLKGLYDSDYIHLRSYEAYSKDFPFYDNSTKWTGTRPPFHNNFYSISTTKIKDCTFYQENCKSSIKIMSGGTDIDNNTFYIKNKIQEDLYCVIRAHRTKDVTIRHNKVKFAQGNLKAIFTIENCLNTLIYNNSISTDSLSCIVSLLNISYSKECVVKKNTFDTFNVTALFNTEYNRTVSIKQNQIVIRHPESDDISLFVVQSNHYSYPSAIEGIIIIERNRIKSAASNPQIVNLNNCYDYKVKFINNKIKQY